MIIVDGYLSGGRKGRKKDDFKFQNLNFEFHLFLCRAVVVSGKVNKYIFVIFLNMSFSNK